MDIASVVGLLLGAAVMVAAVAITPGASLEAFLHYPSLLVVLGGSLAAVLVSFPFRSFLGMAGVTRKVFFNRQPDHNALIRHLVSLAETARRDGLLALESRLDEVTDPFVALAVQR